MKPMLIANNLSTLTPPPHSLDSVVDSHVFGFFAFKARNNCLNKPN